MPVTTVDLPDWPWQTVLQLAGERGAQVWLVGGAVRDALLGRPVHDWDFAVDQDALGLARTVADLGYQASVVPNVPDALEAALQSASPKDLVCITGSIFTVADVRVAWCKRNGHPLPPLDPEV